MREPEIDGLPLSEATKVLDGTKQRELDEQASHIRLAQAERRQDRLDTRFARGKVAAAVSGNTMLPATISALTPHEIRNFSITRLIQSQLEAQRVLAFSPSASRAPLCLEEEIGASLQKD